MIGQDRGRLNLDRRRRPKTRMLRWGKIGLNLASQIVALLLLFVPWDMYQVSILDAKFFCFATPMGCVNRALQLRSIYEEWMEFPTASNQPSHRYELTESEMPLSAPIGPLTANCLRQLRNPVLEDLLRPLPDAVALPTVQVEQSRQQ